jgi:hypothetical protein
MIKLLFTKVYKQRHLSWGICLRERSELFQNSSSSKSLCKNGKPGVDIIKFHELINDHYTLIKKR